MANGQKNLIFSSLKFIEEHIIEILLASIGFFLLVVYLVLSNVKFPSDNATVDKVIIMETFKDKNAALKNIQSSEAFKKALATGFCSKSKKKMTSKEIIKELNDENKKCNGLSSKKVCTKSTCCIWAISDKGKGVCLGGDNQGATQNPADMKIDEYYYLESKHKIN
jgi:hypothetical protein